jgi:carboxyl-terminal processing protease
MKKILLILIVLVWFNNVSMGQVPSNQQKLYYTCKVWGFVKYFHSGVSTCNVNWDSVLIHCLPLIKNATTDSTFNNALDTMLLAAGPMAIATTPSADTMSPQLRRNLNFGWINSPLLRNDVQVMLDTIENNFRPHAECWVENNPNTNSNSSWLIFPHDSLMQSADMYKNYPDEWHRLLMIFKQWNIINYFNPYNYTHNIPWDSTLYHNIVAVDNAATDDAFYIALRKITSDNNDAHTEGLTFNDIYNFPPPNGWYSIPIILKYIPNEYVVVKSAVNTIHSGDAIVSIDGLTTKQWEDSLKPYISAGDTAVFRRFMASYMLYGNHNALIPIVYTDSLGANHTVSIKSDSLFYTSWFYTYYPNDTLANVSWKYWSNCNVGYVNMGILQTTDVSSMYNALRNTNAIIFDIRNYPNGTAWSIASLMYPNQTTFAKFKTPDPTYPGTFYWEADYLGANGNLNSYKGKIILLFNEQTQSQAEFTCMILGAMPNVVKIGSQTAGTDGNISYFDLSPDLQTGFTTLGTFYPNGDSTERVGIIPDTLIFPTAAGIRHNRDEVLEKALEVAACPLSVQDISRSEADVKVYPNPSIGMFVVSLYSKEERAEIDIYNVLDQKIYSSKLNADNTEINLINEPAGLYLYRIVDMKGDFISSGKMVLE